MISYIHNITSSNYERNKKKHKKEDKKHYVYPSGHYVPRKELIREHLSWLEKYLN